MRVLTSTADRAAVVTLIGDLDSGAAPGVQETVLPICSGTGQEVVLDLEQVPYLSSAGLRVLLLIYRQVHAGGGRLALVGVQDAVSDVLSATGFMGFFVVAGTVLEAVTALAAAPVRTDGAS